MSAKRHHIVTRIRRDVPHLADRRLEEAIDVILSLQNGNGGWATYELQRGPSFLEALNPSGAFARQLTFVRPQC